MDYVIVVFVLLRLFEHFDSLDCTVGLFLSFILRDILFGLFFFLNLFLSCLYHIFLFFLQYHFQQTDLFLPIRLKKRIPFRSLAIRFRKLSVAFVWVNMKLLKNHFVSNGSFQRHLRLLSHWYLLCDFRLLNTLEFW